MASCTKTDSLVAASESNKASQHNQQNSSSGDAKEASTIDPKSVALIKCATFNGTQDAWFTTKDGGKLFITKDGGVEWKPAGGAPAQGFTCVDFIDERNGWAVTTKGSVWRSSDGGLTWAELTRLHSNDPGWRFISALEVHFVDPLNGWIIENFSVWHTEDGGKNWAEVFSKLYPRIKGQPVSGAFIGTQTALIGGTRGEIYQTRDGGKTWDWQTLGSNALYNSVNFLDEKTGWLIGFAYDEQTALVYQTQDGGMTWHLQHRVPGNIYPLTSDFADRDKGWLAGRVLGTGNSYLARTEDGGRTWIQQKTNIEADSFTLINFQDDRHGWLVSRDSIYRTQDGGDTWQSAFKVQRYAE